MKTAKALYMFAIMPPEALSTYIHERRQEFASKYNFRSALKPPVHITMHDPFTVSCTKVAEFETKVGCIKRWCEAQAPFEIQLRNYNFLHNPYHPVVYIDVVKNPALKTLHSGFVTQLKKHTSVAPGQYRAYKPHATIGYRDVTPEAFPAIREEYSHPSFEGSFTCNTIYLWKHDHHNWQIVKEFPLNGKEEQLALF